jgi:hypothetical protein
MSKQSKVFIFVLALLLLIGGSYTAYGMGRNLGYFNPIIMKVENSNIDGISTMRWKDIHTGLEFTTLEEKPQRDEQLFAEDVNRGDILYEVRERWQGQGAVLIVEIPYTDSDGYCRYDYIPWDIGSELPQLPIIMSNSCADFGLVSYSKYFEGWNPFNYLKKSGLPPLGPDEVLAIVEDL